MKNKNRQIAQTAIELAIFGSILIFSLGIMINASFNKSNRQNAIYVATRMAMKYSYLATSTMKEANRNSASVLIVEDRLTAASAKYGAVNRTPLIFQGSASHSANMFMPVTFPGCPDEPGEDCPIPSPFDQLEYSSHEDLPLFDFFVNGKHYAFTTSAFKKYDYWSCPRNRKCCDALDDNCGCVCEIESRCVGFGVSVPCANQQVLCDWPLNFCEDCSKESEEQTIAGAGAPCPVFYKKVYRHPLNYQDNDGALEDDRWCTTNAPAPRGEPGCPFYSPADRVGDSPFSRFDLNRNGVYDAGIDVPASPPELRENFSWQWTRVAGWQEKADLLDNGWYRWLNLLEYALGKLGIGIKLGPLVGEGLDDERHKNVDIDVDGDLETERIQEVWTLPGGIVISLGVMDFQEGDVDYTYKGPPEYAPGLLNDVNIYTYVSMDPATGGPTGRGGTYLQIDEGKLFSTSGDTRQFIRTASKKDSIDIIERVFRLSNDTKRFCDLDVCLPTVLPFVSATGLNINPVEACCDCFSGTNISKTCMGSALDKDGEKRHYIYMRTAVKDLHGRKWLTDVSSDPRVNF
jgi:hypothetical protein